jgi:nucleotide-binding universal stress UspA family protein
MSFRDILVHLKSYEAWSAHIDVAADLAKRFNAHLTGLFNDADLAILKHLASGPGGGQEFLAIREAEAAAKLASAKAKFVAEMTRRGVTHSFEHAEGRANEILALVGRFHDLIVTEQTDAAHDEFNWTDAEDAAIRCGRPCLVVPHKGHSGGLGDNIVIAWNGSREASRALSAAMPFIETARQVTVLTGEFREVAPSATRMPALDISSYLARHAKQLRTQSIAGKDREAGEEILAAVQATGADLLVMGAFGRHGFAQMIFGSATGHVLRRLTVPALMAN